MLWETKGFNKGLGTSGLTNIVAMVRKPNNATAGIYNLLEMAAPFSGMYYYDFLTTTSDPAGRYVAMIVSPTEQLQDTHPFEMENPVSLSGLQALISAIIPINIDAYVGDEFDLVGGVEDSSEIVAVVQ